MAPAAAGRADLTVGPGIAVRRPVLRPVLLPGLTPALLLGLLLLGLLPASALAQPTASSWLGIPAARLSATYQRWTYPDLSGNALHQVVQPLQLLLLADLREIGHRPIRASLLGRVDGDPEGEAFQQADLLLGYVEALRLGGLVDLRAGRRIPLDGSTTGGLDGLWLDLSGLPWVGIGGHFGRPVSFGGDHDPPDWSLGAHTWVHGLSWMHLALRYERQEDRPFSVPLRSRTGGDLLLQLHDEWIAFANGDRELRSSTWERLRAGLRYRAPGPLRAKAEMFRYDPLFDPGSVFARLPSDPHWGATGQAEVDLLRSLTAQARWTTRVFKKRTLGKTVAKDRLMPDPTHDAELGLAVRPLPALRAEATAGATLSDEGQSLLASAWAGWSYRPLDLDARIGGYLNAHDRRFSNDPSGLLELFGDSGQGVQRNLATGGWVDLALAPLAQLSFSLRGEVFQDESAYQSARLLARVCGYLY